MKTKENVVRTGGEGPHRRTDSGPTRKRVGRETTATISRDADVYEGARLSTGTDATNGAAPSASVRCGCCGARVVVAPPDELLTLVEIMARYKVKRTKALCLRREVRQIEPGSVLRHGKCIRVAASALDRLWTRD